MRKIHTITLTAFVALMLMVFAQPIMAQTDSTALPPYTGGPAELRMSWWGNDDRAQRTQKVIDLFQATYPDIKIKGEPDGGTSDHFQILDTQLAANNAPDIVQ